MAKQIVVVDDDTDILEFVQLALTFEGYHVRVSTTGRTLQQVRPGELPDLILLDVKLVEEDGRAICKHLKAHELTKDIPIILFSANISESQVRKECPADDFLAKPFSLDTLLIKVEKLLA